MNYICTVDSSSRFPFRARTQRHTHKVTDATDHSTHGSASAGVGNELKLNLPFRLYKLRNDRQQSMKFAWSPATRLNTTHAVLEATIEPVLI